MQIDYLMGPVVSGLGTALLVLQTHILEPGCWPFSSEVVALFQMYWFLVGFRF